METTQKLDFCDAAGIIKDAIVRSRYQAAKLVNKELLGLYYAVGRYVSDNSRGNVWGQGAIKQLSDSLQKELPGLRGFGEVSLKKMRLFYEAWQPIFEDFSNRQLITDDLDESRNFPSRPLIMGDLSENNQFPIRPLIMDELQESANCSNRPLLMDDLRESANLPIVNRSLITNDLLTLTSTEQ